MRDVLYSMVKWITTAYEWFWSFILCRKEPFTYQLTRMMVRHGVFFWIVLGCITGQLFHNIFFSDSLLIQGINIGGLIFLAWLKDHLADQVRLNPTKYNTLEGGN